MSQHRGVAWIVFLALVLSSCGGSGGFSSSTLTTNASVGTSDLGAVLMLFPGAARTVSAQIEPATGYRITGFDDERRGIFGPVQLQAGPEVLVSGIPTGVTTLLIKPLRGTRPVDAVVLPVEIQAGVTQTVVDPILNGLHVQRLRVTPERVVRTPGGSVSFETVGEFPDGSSHGLSDTVEWSARPASVATISDSGLAAALAPGTATIEARLGEVRGRAELSVGGEGPRPTPTPTESPSPTPEPTSTVLTTSGSPSAFGQQVTLTATVSGGGGVPTGQVTFDAGGTPLGSADLSGGVAILAVSSLAVGEHTLGASYAGDGNFEASEATGLPHTVNRAASSTVVTSSFNPSPLGKEVTFTATVSVTAPGGGTPTGSVVFTVDDMVGEPITLSGNTATLSISSLSEGDHTISAAYQGDDNIMPSTSTDFTQEVREVPVLLSSSANPAKFGQEVVLTATVSPGEVERDPTGTVTFTVDGVTGSPLSLVNGQGALSTSSLSVGSHDISVSYSGDANFPSATDSLTQVVEKAETSITLAGSGSPSEPGDPVTLTATVSVDAPGAGTPGGEVTFFEGDTSLGTATVGGDGKATLPVTPDSGSHEISAVYGGDDSFASSTSSSLTQVVKAVISLQLICDDLITAPFLEFFFRPAGTPSPTGSFSVQAGGSPLAVVEFNERFSPFFSEGMTLLEAVYSGDSNYAAASLPGDPPDEGPYIAASGVLGYLVDDLSYIPAGQPRGGVTVLHPEIVVSSNEMLTQATIELFEFNFIDFAIGEKALFFTDTAEISGSFNGTRVLTLSGTATAAEYQAALRSVTFQDLEPKQSRRPAVLWTVTDQSGRTAQDRSWIFTHFINSPPFVTQTVAGVTELVGEPITAVINESQTLPNLQVYDADNGFSGAHPSLEITISGNAGGVFSNIPEVLFDEGSTSTQIVSNDLSLPALNSALSLIQYAATKAGTDTLTITINDNGNGRAGPPPDFEHPYPLGNTFTVDINVTDL